ARWRGRTRVHRWRRRELRGDASADLRSVGVAGGRARSRGERTQRAADHRFQERRVRLGDSDQRGTDDRAAHRRPAGQRSTKMSTAIHDEKGTANQPAWEGFLGALWQKEINVRAFLQLNYTPYD